MDFATYQQKRDEYIANLVNDSKNPFRKLSELIHTLQCTAPSKFLPNAEKKYAMDVTRNIHKIMDAYNVDSDPTIRLLKRNKHAARQKLPEKSFESVYGNLTNNTGQEKEIEQQITTLLFAMPISDLANITDEKIKRELKSYACQYGALIQITIVQVEQTKEIRLVFKSLSGHGQYVKDSLLKQQQNTIRFNDKFYALQLQSEKICTQESVGFEVLHSKSKIEEVAARIKARKEERLLKSATNQTEIAFELEPNEEFNNIKSWNENLSDIVEHGDDDDGTNCSDHASIAATCTSSSVAATDLLSDFSDSIDTPSDCRSESDSNSPYIISSNNNNTELFESVVDKDDLDGYSQCMNVINEVLHINTVPELVKTALFDESTEIIEDCIKRLEDQRMNMELFRKFEVSLDALFMIGIKMGPAIKILHEVTALKLNLL